MSVPRSSRTSGVVIESFISGNILSTQAESCTVQSFSSAFAVDLYKKMQQEHQDDNIFFSPLSIGTALLMVMNGARGPTAKQIESVLHISKSTGDPASKKCPAGPHQHETNVAIRVANRLYADKSFRIREEYQTLLERSFNARVETVDFRSHSEDARVQINNWVSRETNEKIKDLLAEGVVDSFTSAVFVNAVYFRGLWRYPFHVKTTWEETFFGTRGETLVHMMHATIKLQHVFVQDLEADIIQLWYQGETTCLTVLLPKKRDGLLSLESKLTADKLDGLFDNLSSMRADVVLPKFKLEQSAELTHLLNELGIHHLLSDRPDLSGISEDEGLRISAVVHKAFIEVDEKGTEAAAATAVISKKSAFRDRHSFKVDHPFLFLIRSRTVKTPIFIGAVRNL